jgi:hypothetical protein
MSVLGGFWGVEGGSVDGAAHLIVDGGTVYDHLSVSGNGQADIHSGTPFAAGNGGWEIEDFGIIRFFGSNFTLDGASIGPGDILADAGNRFRGVLDGILASGDAISIPLYMADSGIVRIVPEPGTGLLMTTALATWLATNRRRRPARAPQDARHST